MSAPSGGEAPYRVIFSDVVQQQLRDLFRRAAEGGQLVRVDAAAKTIVGRLHTDPDVFGEPRYTLRALQLTMRDRGVLPLSVVFAVDSQRRLVYVKEFRFVARADG